MVDRSGKQIIQCHPDTRLEVLKEFNLDTPGRMEDAIDLLKDWIQKQTHFIRKDFSRVYLEHILIISKGSVERSKERLDKMCTLRTVAPHFFDVTDIKSQLAPLFKKIIFTGMPKLTENHERIIVYQLMTVEFDTTALYMCAKMFTVDIYGMRMKNIFFLSDSKVAEYFLSIFKQFLSKKISDRLIILKSHTDLLDHVSTNTLQLLPEDYGGQEKSLKEFTNDWLDELSTPENKAYYNETKQFKTDEAHRQTGKFNEAYMGMPGSFRALSVD